MSLPQEWLPSDPNWQLSENVLHSELNMAGNERWYFTKEQLAATPSRKHGIDADKELSYRQQAATLIQDMGQRLQVTQLCINTAIVYMHRFYMFHSFQKFHRNMISSCALFLAAKVEEQPRKLEHVIKMSHACLFRENQPLDVKSEAYNDQATELVANENFMLQTLGFELAVQHPHTSVVNCCQLVRASKDLAQTSYFMATNSLHLTTMCLQYKPTVVACVCIHLACKWSSWEIPRSSEGKDWFYYVDDSVTKELLDTLTSEFIAILDKCPSRLKRKIMSGGSNGPNNCNPIPKAITDDKKNSSVKSEAKNLPSCSKTSTNQSTTESNAVQQRSPSGVAKKVKTETTVPQQSNKIPTSMSFSAYQEKKRAQERAQMQQKEQTKQLEQTKSNVSKQSVNPISRELNLPDAAKPINSEKQLFKQNQINIDKQRQIDERNRNLIKPNLDHLFDSTSNTRPANTSKNLSSHSAQQKHSQNNLVSEDFLDNLVNKPLNNMHFNSIFAVEGDDSSDFKKEIATDLKMEFSDNDSNQSSVGLNLTAIPSAFMNDSSDSKTGLNTQSNSIADGAKTTSFMSIFSTPSTLTSTPLSQPKIEKMDKAENSRNNIPANVKYDALLRIKPEIPTPPPMLSPLKQDFFNTTPNNHETQTQLSNFHNSKNENSASINKLDVVSDTKPSFSMVHTNNTKASPIVQKSKSPPKNRLSQNQQKSLNIGHTNTPQLAIKKEKEVLDVPPMPQIMVKKEKEVSDLPPMPQITIKKEKDVTDVAQNAKIPELYNSYNFGINNGNKTGMNPIPAVSVQSKSELREIANKSIDIPSVNASKQLSSNSTSIDFGIKQNTELQQKSAFYSCPSPQTNINNVINVNNNISPIDVCDSKIPLCHNKDVKDKQQHSHEHHERHHHHKSRHHSHKSSKHKEKHKHKHKDKDREKDKEKHKRKDKERDREKRNKNKDMDTSFKIDKSSPIDDYEQSSAPRESIKLKISKKKLSVDEPDKSDASIQNPLKLRIQLKDTKLGQSGSAGQSPIGSNNGNASRKRKSSPKASKKEKITKHDNETHVMCDNIANDEPVKSKKSNSSLKKNSLDLNVSKVSDTKPLVNAVHAVNAGALAAHATMRSSKAHHK